MPCQDSLPETSDESCPETVDKSCLAAAETNIQDRIRNHNPLQWNGCRTIIEKETLMDLLKDDIKPLYFKYLAASFGSTLIMSIYALVDTIVIGHYEGPDGTAAVAAITPLWTVMFAFGLMFGIGGSVLMAQNRGAGDEEKARRFFTSSVFAAITVAALLTVLYLVFLPQLIRFCGARGHVLTLGCRYMRWIAATLPSFLIAQALVPFIRSDGSPLHATYSVMAGGIFNVFGDLFFVFGLDMGISGAGLATAIGELISFTCLVSYFFRKKCRLRLAHPGRYVFSYIKKIFQVGISNFVIDLAMGILNVMFNNQVMALLDSSALAVYGVISNLATNVQTFGYAIGESAQSIYSTNFGARQHKRTQEAFRLAASAAFLVGAICLVLTECVPFLIVRIYMSATPQVLQIAPRVLRTYGIAFIFLVFNVSSTYYFQAIAKPAVSLSISLARGFVLSGILVYLLPLVFGAGSLWTCVPITEFAVFLYVNFRLKQSGITLFSRSR